MTASQKHVIIGLIMYPAMTALDIVGPQTVFNSLPGVQLQLIRRWHTQWGHLVRQLDMTTNPEIERDLCSVSTARTSLRWMQIVFYAIAIFFNLC